MCRLEPELTGAAEEGNGFVDTLEVSLSVGTGSTSMNELVLDVIPKLREFWRPQSWIFDRNAVRPDAFLRVELVGGRRNDRGRSPVRRAESIGRGALLRFRAASDRSESPLVALPGRPDDTDWGRELRVAAQTTAVDDLSEADAFRAELHRVSSDAAFNLLGLARSNEYIRKAVTPVFVAELVRRYLPDHRGLLDEWADRLLTQVRNGEELKRSMLAKSGALTLSGALVCRDGLASLEGAEAELRRFLESLPEATSSDVAPDVIFDLAVRHCCRLGFNNLEAAYLMVLGAGGS